MSVVPEATALLRRGLAVFPLPAGARVPASGWQRLVTTDPEVLPMLLTDGSNLGVACRASRMAVLDLDVEGGGPGRLALLAHRLGQPWPVTLTVHTPRSGGQHLYFRVPPGVTVMSSSGGRSGLGPGIDVRGPGRRSGGYVVGPGSRTVQGRYLLARDVGVAALPAWIAVRLTVSTSLERP